jgi:hypothetical protein
MLTVKQILRVTPDKVKNKSNLVKIIRVKKAVIYNGKAYYILNCKTKVDEYDCEVVLTTDKKPTKASLPKLKAWMHCNCGHFKFRCEHYLAKHGSSTKILTRGIKPGEGGTYEVNPRGIPWICKHLVRVLEQLPRIRIKEGRLPLKLAVKLSLPEAEKRIPK